MRRTQFQWWLIPLLLWAFWLGIRLLNADVLWFDEAKTVLFTGAQHFGPKSVSQIWTDFAETNAWQSPGYYITLSYWSQLVGWSDFASRSLSLFFGMLSLAWVYRLGRDMFHPRVGLYAVAILIGSSVFIHYTHEMRPYTLYILTTAISFWAYWHLITQQTDARWFHYLMLYLGLVGMAYTHALALLATFGMGFYHLFFASKNRHWVILSGIMLFAVISFLPWAQYTLTLISEAGDDSIRQAVTLFGIELLDVTLTSFASGNLAILLLLLLSAWLTQQGRNRMLWSWLVITLAVAMVLSYLVPAFIHVRYLMSIWVVLALLASIGLHNLSLRGLPASILLIIWLGLGALTARNTNYFESLPNSQLNIPRTNFIEMQDYLTEYTRSQDMVVLHTAPPTEEWASDDIHDYYLHDVSAPITHMELIKPFPREATDASYQEAIDEVLGDRPLIWTGIAHTMPFSRRRLAFFEQIETSHTLCQQVINDEDMTVALYAQPSGAEVASFAEGAITVNALWAIPQNSDETIDLFLGITRAPDLPPDTYSIGLHVYDEMGALVAQQDYGLSNNPFACQWSQLTVPQGDYTLAMIVYNWQTLERLAPDSDSLTDNRADLGQVSIRE